MIRFWNLRPNPVLILTATALVTGAVVISVAVSFQVVIDNESRDTIRNAQALVAAVDMSNSIGQIEELNLGSSAQAGATLDVHGHLPLADATAAHGYVGQLAQASRRLERLEPSKASIDMRTRADAVATAFIVYLVDTTPGRYQQMLTQIRALETVAEAEVTTREAALTADQSALRSQTRLSSDLIIALALITALITTTTALIIGRRLRKNVTTIDAERLSLIDANRAIERRNQQFASLYQIVSEVTETLSLTYVVRTTIREARKLVGADVTVVRLLDHGQLIIAGSDGDDETVPAPGPLALGVGIQGRAAKRGRTIRIDTEVDAEAAEGECAAGMQSGVVVPLIVGARVIGTLACWSWTSDRFDEDDERALELMASQVATAIAAADMHEQSEHEAHSDALTSLPNRRQLNDDLRGVLLEASHRETPHAIAMVDIDHFKRFNDEYGHRVGDITLQKVADVLKSSLREEDRVYRFGGEEFLIVYAGATAENALKLAERARSAVERAPLTGDALQPVGPVTISIGVALFPDDGHDMEALIDVADRAMYVSKEMGRNRVTLSGHEPERLTAAA